MRGKEQRSDARDALTALLLAGNLDHELRVDAVAAPVDEPLPRRAGVPAILASPTRSRGLPGAKRGCDRSQLARFPLLAGPRAALGRCRSTD
jgi:hypothetical protein